MARRPRSRFVRPAPRTKMWIGYGVGSTTLVGSAAILVGSLGAAQLLLRPFTILRTRALLTFESDQAAVSERPIGSYGSIIVTDAASAAGVASIPSPSSLSGNPEADWFIWQALTVSFEFLSSVGFEGNVQTQYVIDSKAMRKVGPDDDLVIMADMDTASGAVIVDQGRMLIQLH